MKKLLLVLVVLAFVGVAHAESPFAIRADSAINVSATGMPDFVGLDLDRFIQKPPDDQGGDDLASQYDGEWDKDSLEQMRNPEYYVYIDNAPDQSGGPTYTWYDISDGTEINFSGPDDQVAALTLPSSFVFYDNSKFDTGGSYDTLYVSTNFLLGFEQEFYDNGSYADYANRAIPFEGSLYDPHAFFAAFWDDGVMLENSRCYYDTVGDLFIVSWNDWGIRGYEDLVDGTVSLQVALDMTTYEFHVYYKDVEVPGTGHNYGGSATIGAEGSRGWLGFFYVYMDETVLDDADALAVFEWAQPDAFDFPDPGGDDPDNDGAYEVEQGDPYGPFSWTASSQNNDYGPSQISYSVELWEDISPTDRLIQPSEVDGWEEIMVFSDLTSSTSYTISGEDTAGIPTVPYGRQDSGGDDITIPHYQLAVFATDGWGYTEADNTEVPGHAGDIEYHYWLDVIEATMLPDLQIEETTWGAIKANDF